MDLSLRKGNNHCNIKFSKCLPGKYRISNMPILAMKNSIVEFTHEFYLQEITVSLGLYEFVFDKPYTEMGPLIPEKMNYPWHSIDFREVQEFLAALNKIVIENGYSFSLDIPTIAEWEHALLCGKDMEWSWGNNDDELYNYGWFIDNSEDKIHHSKQKKPNEWGLYDMYGNVYEYCYDIINENESSYFKNPSKKEPEFLGVMPCMGGSFDSSLENCKGYNLMGYRNMYIEPTGIRLIIREHKFDVRE